MTDQPAGWECTFFIWILFLEKNKHSSYTLYFLTVQAGFIVNKLRSAICVLKCFLLIFATEAGLLKRLPTLTEVDGGLLAV